MQKVDDLISELDSCLDGRRVGEILDLLIKRLNGKPSCNLSKEALAKFFISTGNEIQQSWCGFALAVNVAPGDLFLEQIFSKGISDGRTRTPSLLGLINVSGENAYPALQKIVLSTESELEGRLYALELLSLSSGQSFCRSISKDLSEWSLEELPVDALKDWKEAGFPTGTGISPPRRHPDLDNPKSDLDLAAKTLDHKLSVYRCSDPFAFVEPRGCLYHPEHNLVQSISKTWNLPKPYLEFISKFSPLAVEFKIRGNAESFTLYGVDDIAKGQRGYSVNGITGEPIEDWPSDYVVIAQSWGDPLIIDCSKNTDSVPIYFAKHGQGNWKFRRKFQSLLEFLESLSIPNWDGHREHLPNRIKGFS